ncbi:hypothetical protein DB31_7202 [Hyalangium minutum]|uniref:Uncharacterized protein n=1 Tax=Hyalangium minutum TaxID=394096 RepID=A0A085WJV2_9BACT|nr:hypothetical protein DB31_7202 [Hyalangium minutum]
MFCPSCTSAAARGYRVRTAGGSSAERQCPKARSPESPACSRIGSTVQVGGTLFPGERPERSCGGSLVRARRSPCA